MSEFLEKANQSLESAKCLAKQHYYASTVNRSYYACFQYIMHVLFVKLKKNQDEFYQEVRQRPNGTHSWASKLIGNELAGKDKDDYRWFQSHIPQFRELRVKADYYPTIVSQDQGVGSIAEAENVMRLLIKHFK